MTLASNDSRPADPPAPGRPTFEALWKAAFNTYYDCFYNEVLADRLIDRWLLVDDLTKILVAITASGSALSGWTLWNQPGYKAVWVAFASLAAVLAIVHTSLTVAHRLRDWGEIKRAFASLRIELETFLYRMRLDGEASEPDLQRDFLQHRRKYPEVVQRSRNDSLLTRGLKVAAQREVDRRIARDQIGDATYAK